MKVFIFGAGFSARAFARLISGKGVAVSGTTRSESRFDLLRSAGLSPYLFDGLQLTADVKEQLSQTTHLLVSAAPGEDGDPVLNAARSTIAEGMPALQWMGYLSTVGVYGNHDGAWVDETSSCNPVSKRSKFRVAAEQQWIDFGEARDVPAAILRLSGIYGPGRNAFIKLDNGSARRLIKPDQVFNRIHVTDIARAIDHLGQARLGGIFNVTDDEPAPPQDVVAFAAELMGVEIPPDIPFEKADLTPMARSFYGENKRVSNARLKSTGFEFCYPDYRKSHASLWSQNNWREE
ncbi:MAG: SDR family oxidoreductase [Rhizobiaceae bacterium]